MSAKKRTSLDAVFAAEELPAPKPSRRTTAKTTPEEVSKASQMDAQPHQRTEGSKRPAVKQHTAYLPLAVHEQLRRLAFEENRKMHDYLLEGLDRVFADRGLRSIKDAH